MKKKYEGYSWKTLNISLDTHKELMYRRVRGESMNNLIRRLLQLPTPDPTRPSAKRTYYDEDIR